MAGQSRYLTAVEVAQELRFERADGTLNMKAFYAWRYRHRARLPAVKRGRGLLFLRSDVDLAVRHEREHVNRFLQRRPA